MKCMSRNKTSFFYALYITKSPILDDYGNQTGEYTIQHGQPIPFTANISAAKGETTTNPFGDNESYDKIIVMDNSAPPIDEYTVLWIDTVPLVDENGDLALDGDGEAITPHDYIVKKVARSLNSVSIAISKVQVS